MQGVTFTSKKNGLLNILVSGLLLVTLLLYWCLAVTKPSLQFIFLLFLVNFSILGYVLAVHNTIRYVLTDKSLIIKWWFGSSEIKLNTIQGYFEWKEPLFEFHLEANFLGAKLRRNEIGEFYYYSPGVRKGMVVEYSNRSNDEKLFIVPKKSNEFIDMLRITLMEKYGKKIEDFNNRFYVK